MADDTTTTPAAREAWVIVGTTRASEMVTEHEATHVCGSHGFGLRSDDICPRCEVDRRLSEQARAVERQKEDAMRHGELGRSSAAAHVLARRFAADLFTNGRGERAHRLLLTQEHRAGDLGGLSIEAVERRIFDALTAGFPAAGLAPGEAAERFALAVEELASASTDLRHAEHYGPRCDVPAHRERVTAARGELAKAAGALAGAR